MSGPAVLSEVRNNRVEKNELSLDESDEEEWVDWLRSLSDEVVLLDSLRFEETMLECLLVSDLIIVLGGLLDCVTDLIFKDLVP